MEKLTLEDFDRVVMKEGIKSKKANEFAKRLIEALGKMEFPHSILLTEEDAGYLLEILQHYTKGFDAK